MTITKKRIMAVLIVLAVVLSVAGTALAASGTGRVSTDNVHLREKSYINSAVKGFVHTNETYIYYDDYVVGKNPANNHPDGYIWVDVKMTSGANANVYGFIAKNYHRSN